MIGTGPAAGATAEDAELQEWRRINEAVQVHWVRREIAALDTLFETHRTTQARTASGYWKLSFAYNHLDDNFLAQNCMMFPLGEDWVAIDKWIEAHPQSPTPVVLKAMMLVRQAQNCIVFPRTARVKPLKLEGEKPEANRIDFLRAARDLLLEHKGFAVRDPHWHTAMLRVLRLQDAGDEELLLAHMEALAAHPLYYQTHQETFRELITRWYPNLEQIDAFAGTVLEGTRSKEGHQVYARLYEDAAIELNQGQLFAPDNRVWERMRRGYEEISARYPTAWNAHHFAFNACMADDTTTLRRLFASFAGPPVRPAWQSAIIYRQCRDMAGTEAK